MGVLFICNNLAVTFYRLQLDQYKYHGSNNTRRKNKIVNQKPHPH